MFKDPGPVVHIVDDDESVRRALARVLTVSGYDVRSYASAGDFLVAAADAAGCLLLDMELPGASGLDLQRALHRLGNPVPIVFMSAYSDIPRTVAAIKAGASDFLVKPFETAQLLAAIETAIATEAGRVERMRSIERQAAALNEREFVVLRAIAAGRLNKQIGFDLGLSERTIKACRAQLMRKLHARSFAELVRVSAPLLD